MSILSTSPTATRHFDMNIAAALGDINAAVIVQQLDYWMKKEEVGIVIEGVKYVYNTFVDWVNSQFKWLTVWKFRHAMDILRSLSIVKVIRYKSRQWNQTNYYSLDYDALAEFIKSKTAESIEISDLWSSPPQSEESQTLEVRDSKVSYKETKNTSQKDTAKRKGDRQNQNNNFAAASLKNELEEEKNQKGSNPHSVELSASISQNKAQSDSNKLNTDKEKRNDKIDYIVNKEILSLLDSADVPINKTIKDLLKLYSAEKVENAITLLKTRKRESHVPNPSGYFVAALKGDWGSKNLVDKEGDLSSEGIDQAAIFRHWYDLARELGYCSGTEVREGKQWVRLSGSWEEWSSAVKRGYSLEYLKKIMKRNQS